MSILKLLAKAISGLPTVMINPSRFLPLGIYQGYSRKIFEDNAKSIEELEKAIINCFRSVPAEMLHRVIASFQNRLRMVVIAQGEHIENIKS